MAINGKAEPRLKIIRRVISAAKTAETSTAAEVEQYVSGFINDGWTLFHVHFGETIKSGEILEAYAVWYHLVK